MLVKVVTVILTKINVPQGEINTLLEQLGERGVSAMFSNANYDVQAIRREARAEAREEARAEADQQKTEIERRLKSMINAMLSNGSTIKDVASIMDVAEQDITSLIPELLPA